MKYLYMRLNTGAGFVNAPDVTAQFPYCPIGALPIPDTYMVTSGFADTEGQHDRMSSRNTDHVYTLHVSFPAMRSALALTVEAFLKGFEQCTYTAGCNAQFKLADWGNTGTWIDIGATGEIYFGTFNTITNKDSKQINFKIAAHITDLFS